MFPAKHYNKNKWTRTYNNVMTLSRGPVYDDDCVSVSVRERGGEGERERERGSGKERSGQVLTDRRPIILQHCL